MDYLVIEGVKPWDGRYEFDLEAAGFTTREWGWIKRLSGYLPLTIDDGFRDGDPELFTVFAAIALRRAGRIQNREVPEVYERLVDTEFETTIRLESETEDLEEADKADTSSLDPSAGKSSANGSTSGPSSSGTSERSDDRPRSIGTPVSATSESPSPTSEN